MKLMITQRPENGFLGGPIENSFTTCYRNADYTVEIGQFHDREITICAETEGSYKEILKVYYDLISLLMLFDGQFYPVLKAFENDTETTHSWKRRELPCYHSADFMLGNNELVDFEFALNEKVLSDWSNLRTELALIHNMVLYCLSSVEMPKDMQCAFMIEVFEGLGELVSEKRTISFPKAKSHESQLKINLNVFIQRYGKKIFQNEMSINADRFTQILVDSRNKIGHIKSKQNRTYLNGGECVMYLRKLSLLYRVVMFDLLGIDDHAYSDRLVKQIQNINDHDITKVFIKKLNDVVLR